MRKIVYTCDRCKQEIEGNPVKIFIEEVTREEEDILCEVLYPELRPLDFCKSCSKLFVDMVNRKCSTGVPATINREFENAVQEMTGIVCPPTVAEEKGRRKIDTGKVQALRNAGWTVKAIAEEMSCSEQAVYNVLKKAENHVDNKKAPEPEPAEQSKTN